MDEFLIQLVNDSIFTDSMAIGINEWLAPQISEHWPKKMPGLVIVKVSWFRRPGMASAFTPRVGTAQEWITSAAVTRVRISVIIGRTARLSTSRRRNAPLSRSVVGIM